MPDSIVNVKPLKNVLWLEAGINFSKYQNVDSEFKNGYTAGMNISHKLINQIELNYSLLLSQQNLVFKNKFSTWTDDEYVYKRYFDLETSMLFIEIPVMLQYKFWDNKSSSLYFGLGLGYSLSIKNEYTEYNYRNSNDILTTIDNYSVPVCDYYEDDKDYSCFNINTSIKIKYKKVLLDFMYYNKRFLHSTIGKENTFSLSLGYQISRF